VSQGGGLDARETSWLYLFKNSIFSSHLPSSKSWLLNITKFLSSLQAFKTLEGFCYFLLQNKKKVCIFASAGGNHQNALGPA